MTRIIGGVAGGRRLAVPPHGTRPTSDRVREALFSSLDHEVTWPTTRVLDLFAGSGALGLEAASRGAVHALLVERSRRAVDVIRRNIVAVGLGSVEVLMADVERLAAQDPRGAPADLVLADPPYDLPSTVLHQALVGLAEAGWMAPEALVVVERPGGEAAAWPVGFEAIRERRYGDTALWFGRRALA